MGILLAFVRKIIYSLLLLIAVIILNFLLIHLAPGDPVDTLVGEMGGATPELVAKIRAEYGLDKNFFEQLTSYIGKVARGNLGNSYTFNQPVTRIIFHRLPATVLLVVSALLIALFFGTLLGGMAAQKPDSLFSHFVTVFSLTSFSAPVFWTGIMLLILFSYYIPIFPSFGMSTVGLEGPLIVRMFDTLKHLFLPAITLSSIYLAAYSRIARASMMDVLGSDYIRTARAKGLSKQVVVYKHALKNALLPVVTLVGLQLSQIVAGAVVVETVFSWPGIGSIAFKSILRRDYTLLLGILFFSTVIVVIANLITDLTYRILDPRIK
ncbi:MAG: ABC transporter permease [Deltaproteobacteria bacterium]|nr:ABC transporter permease [Deltaproteobacteria bacterium]